MRKAASEGGDGALVLRDMEKKTEFNGLDNAIIEFHNLKVHTCVRRSE